MQKPARKWPDTIWKQDINQNHMIKTQKNLITPSGIGVGCNFLISYLLMFSNPMLNFVELNAFESTGT